MLHADLRDVLMTLAKLHDEGADGSALQAFTVLFEALRRKVNVLYALIRCVAYRRTLAAERECCAEGGWMGRIDCKSRLIVDV